MKRSSTTRKKYTLSLDVVFLCTQNLSIGSRNIKDFDCIDVVLKFIASECTKFNGHAMDLVLHDSLNVTSHMITWITIMKNAINYCLTVNFMFESTSLSS